MKVDKLKCNGCHACFSICSKKSISMVADDEGFLYPQIDKETCSDCALCQQVCPINKQLLPKEDLSVAYAVKNMDLDVRKNSSSGGVFTAIAEYVIDQGGVVFGVAFNENFEVIHVGVDKKEELYKLRGSKYVQSKIGKTYEQAKELLVAGKLVLFTGTPCQIGGLKAYLKKDYTNLYTQDLICHGAPSPKVWKTYLSFLEKKYNSKIKDVQFRCKEKSWKNYSIRLIFENGLVVLEPFSQNIYMRAFLKNLLIRPSCYNCSFKGIERVSDLTLGDFWGIENVDPKMDDDKGTSLLIIHTHKGQQLLEKVANKLVLSKTNLDEAIKENPSAIKSSLRNQNREKFLGQIKDSNFEKILNRYTQQNFFKKNINRAKRLIKKLKKK